MCLAQGHNAVTPVRLKPAAPRSRVKHSTTEPLHSPFDFLAIITLLHLLLDYILLVFKVCISCVLITVLHAGLKSINYKEFIISKIDFTLINYVVVFQIISRLQYIYRAHRSKIF